MIAAPEIRLVMERALARRAVLEDLLDVVPREFWQRAEAPGEWDAHTHLAHLAAMDEPMPALFGAALQGERELVPLGATTAADWMAARDRLLESTAGLPIAELRQRLARSRAAAIEALARLTPPHLELPVRLAVAVDSWGRPACLPLRAYLSAWVDHDLDHAAAIRRAIAVAPSPGHLAIAARWRR